MPAAGTGDAAVNYRLQALLTRCQSVAGEQGPGPEAEAFLQQTLQLAEQYGMPTWELLTAFVTAMLVQWQHEAAAVNALVKQQLLFLVQRPLQLLQCLLREVWPELQGQRAAHVGTVLQLVQAALAQAGKQAQSGVRGLILWALVPAGALPAGGTGVGSEAGEVRCKLWAFDWQVSCACWAGSGTSSHTQAAGPPSPLPGRLFKRLAGMSRQVLMMMYDKI